MHNETSWTASPVATAEIALERIWTVWADPSYRVRRQSPHSDELILVRTLSGRGRMEFFGGGGLDLPGETLVAVENPRIAAYWCAAERWNFWWFHVRIGGVPPLPLHHRLAVPRDDHEQAHCDECFRLLTRPSHAARAQASAVLSAMLYRWLANWRGQRVRPQPHRAAIERVIERMRAARGAPLTVCQMAAEAGLGERRFREVFRVLAGKGPKEYYDELRLGTAAELLRMGALSVAQIAERLGYSSPFHFSRAFRERFGAPPSRYRPA